MTLKRHLLIRPAQRASLPLAGLGIVAAALSGCGGATQNGANLAPTHDSGPVIYGINANANRSIATQETSGITFTSGTATEGAVVGVTSYITTHGPGPLSTYQSTYPNGVPSNGVTSSPGVPLGFASGAAYFNAASTTVIAAVPTNYTGSLTFGAYASQGIVNNNLVDIVPSSIVLTSPESSSFSLPLTFDPNFGSGILAQTQYKSAPFPIPAFMQTTGLHDLRTTIADADGNSSTTDFAVATVDPASVALFLQSITVLVPAVAATATTPAVAATTTTTAITPGDLVTIDGGAGTGVYPAGYQPTVADPQGTVVLFTTPGTHTVTETDPTGKTVVQTETFTLASTAAGTTLLAPPNPDGAPAAASARPLVIHPAAKRSVRR